MIHNCRNCHEPLTVTFADLGRQPPPNNLLADPDQSETIYPLHAYVCKKCFLVQIPDTVAPKDMFTEYSYFSSNSKGFLTQCKQYAERMSETLAFIEHPYVVEIASNDGYLLQYFKELGIECMGIDPAKNVAAAAEERGIPTDVAFFGAERAQLLADSRPKPDLIIANNVLAHVPDLHDFIEGIRILLKPTGTATIEFPVVVELD